MQHTTIHLSYRMAFKQNVTRDGPLFYNYPSAAGK